MSTNKNIKEEEESIETEKSEVIPKITTVKPPATTEQNLAGLTNLVVQKLVPATNTQANMIGQLNEHLGLQKDRLVFQNEKIIFLEEKIKIIEEKLILLETK